MCIGAILLHHRRKKMLEGIDRVFHKEYALLHDVGKKSNKKIYEWANQADIFVLKQLVDYLENKDSNFHPKEILKASTIIQEVYARRWQDEQIDQPSAPVMGK